MLLIGKIEEERLDNLELVIRIQTRSKPNAAYLRNRLIGYNNGQVQDHRRLHVEVLGSDQKRYMIRLIRRPIDDDRCEEDSLPQFVFQILHASENERTPQPFIQAFRMMRSCILLLGCQPIQFSTLYHDGELHRIGQDLTDSAFQWREVVDFN